MKTTRHLTLSLLLAATALHAQGADVSPPVATAEQPAKAIPFDQLGAAAQKLYSGDAIGITATAEGATLRTGFQKLAGTVTREGLRLNSTEAAGGSLQLTASAIGRVAGSVQALSATGTVVGLPPEDRSLLREQGADGSKQAVRPVADPPTGPVLTDAATHGRSLLREQGAGGSKQAVRTVVAPPTGPVLTDAATHGRDCKPSCVSPGNVTSTINVVSFIRPGLTEEYSVSVDGVRQDFIVAAAPAGSGALSVELALSGATAEAAAEGAKLTLAGSGRVLAYSRLQGSTSQTLLPHYSS